MPNNSNTYVHVVGTVNTDAATGRILYVTPSKGLPGQFAAGLDQPGDPTGVELIIEASDETELARFPLTLLRASDNEESASALIDEIVPIYDGMARLRLMCNGVEAAQFEAGSDAVPAPAGVSLGMAPPGGGNKRAMSLDAAISPEPGISYTVQVRPEGDRLWQTIAMGRPVPDVTLDRNQFPDAERAAVRIIRTNGFSEAIVAEDIVELSDPN